MRANRLTRCMVYSGAPGKGLRASYAPFSSPTGEGPHPYAFSPAIPAAAYLGIPTDAKLIKAVMRGILAAISAEPAESLGSVAQWNFAAPCEVQECRPISNRRKHPSLAIETDPAAKTGRLMQRSKADSVENIAKGEGNSGMATIVSSDKAPTPLHQPCQLGVFEPFDAKSAQWHAVEQLHRPQAR